jgi:23S rRNA pseudouridine1911/1915/1917 synthase
MILAKSAQAAAQLRSLFRAREIERTYIAVVAGVLSADSGRFESYLATARNLDRYSTQDEAAGELAVTHYRRLRQSAIYTVLEVSLETGRRNQIRVHFAEAGHPVLGDPRYGRAADSPTLWTERRLALHAARLAFRHPSSGELLRLDSPLPAAMQRLFDEASPAPRDQPHDDFGIDRRID